MYMGLYQFARAAVTIAQAERLEQQKYTVSPVLEAGSPR